MSDLTAWFGELSPIPGARSPFTPRMTWTLIGTLAIPLWATWPALSLRATSVPPFELLAIMFGFGSLVLTGLYRSKSVRGAAPTARKHSWLTPLLFAMGVSGADVFFILATHRIPAAQANLISYLWPLMVVGGGAAFGLFRLRPRQMVGIALGFGGAVILIWDGHVSMSLSGIGLALLSGMCWATYCIFLLTLKKPVDNTLSRGCAISTLLCASLHFVFEPTVTPSVGAFAAAAVAGILPTAVGYFVWDEGFRRADSQLLAVIAYATPLCSALILAALGAASLTWNLLAGGVVIMAPGYLSRTDT
jgi:drug/metabolite transporter (DMT)-like permease